MEADGIIEATAPGGRVDRVMAALESGKDVIMAKPPVLNLEDLLAIRDRKNELGQQVHVATQKRYFPAYYKIKSIMSTKILVSCPMQTSISVLTEHIGNPASIGGANCRSPR